MHDLEYDHNSSVKKLEIICREKSGVNYKCMPPVGSLIQAVRLLVV